MTWPFVPEGDAEAAVLDILLNETPELETVSNLTIQLNLIGYSPGKRWIHIIQEGALRKWPTITRQRIDVECYADQRSVAYDLATICYASLVRSMGSYKGFGLALTDVRLEAGIARIPDKLQETNRYTFSVRLTTVPYGPPIGAPS